MKTKNSNSMSIEKLNQLRSDVLKSLSLAEAQLEMETSSPSLSSHNSICMFGCGLTVSVTDGKAQFNNGIIASQFTPDDAARVCDAVTNGAGEHPLSVSPREYYSKTVIRLRETMDLISEIERDLV